MELGVKFPQKETINSPKQEWRSSYNGVVLNTLEKSTRKRLKKANPFVSESTLQEKVDQEKEKLGRYLDLIDRELVDNFSIFESKENPGVRFPYSVISVNKVANEANPNRSNLDKTKKIIYVTFRPFSPSPSGGPEVNLNSDYDRILMSLPKVKDPKTAVKFYTIGLPTSMWGSVSKEWVDGLEKGVEGKDEYGISQFGKLYAEFLQSVIGQEEKEVKDTSYVFYGGSFGAILASETAKKVPQIWGKLKLLLDVPTGVHKPASKSIKLPFVGTLPLSLKGLQVIMGFAPEVAMRMAFDSIVKSALSADKPAQKALDEVLRKRGIVPFDGSEQNKLKQLTLVKEIKLLIRGTPLDTDHFRSYIAQGMLDPSMINIKMFKLMQREVGARFFKAGERSLGIGVNYPHWMDRGRWPEKWMRAIDQYEN